MIDPKNIIDTADIKKMAGVGTTTLQRWRHHPTAIFPGPIVTVGSGLALYDREQVQAWLDEHVVVGRNGTPHIRYTINH